MTLIEKLSEIDLKALSIIFGGYTIEEKKQLMKQLQIEKERLEREKEFLDF
jgi:hypothetical protein